MEITTPKCDPQAGWERLFCNMTKNTSSLHTDGNQSYIENANPTLARNKFLQCHVKPEHRTEPAMEKPTQKKHPQAGRERICCNMTKNTSFVGITENQKPSKKYQINWKCSENRFENIPTAEVLKNAKWHSHRTWESNKNTLPTQHGNRFVRCADTPSARAHTLTIAPRNTLCPNHIVEHPPKAICHKRGWKHETKHNCIWNDIIARFTKCC